MSILNAIPVDSLVHAFVRVKGELESVTGIVLRQWIECGTTRYVLLVEHGDYGTTRAIAEGWNVTAI